MTKAAAVLVSVVTAVFATVASPQSLRAAPTRVACVGDSITRAGGGGAGYPGALARMLGPGFQVRRFGNPEALVARGSSHAFLRSSEHGAGKGWAPDVVVIMLGSNDARGSWGPGDGRDFRSDLRALVNEYAALPNRPRIFLACPPPLLRPNLRNANEVLREDVVPNIARVAEESGSTLIKVWDGFFPTPARYFGAGDGVDIGDGVHPNDAGAERIATLVHQAVLFDTADAGVPDAANDAAADATADATADASDAAGDARDAPRESGGSTMETLPPIIAPDTAPPVSVDQRMDAPDTEGCGCRIPGRPTGATPGAWLLTVVLGALLARRVRR